MQRKGSAFSSLPREQQGQRNLPHTGAQWEELEEVGRVTSHSYSGGQGEALVGEDFHVGLASHSSYHALNEQMTGKMG